MGFFIVVPALVFYSIIVASQSLHHKINGQLVRFALIVITNKSAKGFTLYVTMFNAGMCNILLIWLLPFLDILV
ncbi:MAG: hypothetical protein JWQ96_2170, partial [Segetibacter sp.]|nr:hypothetical protein [Segetibacter sp.]